jgi:gliding motility-associated-like protein
MKNAILVFAILILYTSFLWSQKQSNIWYFGRDGVGLDFNCIPPSVVTGHTMVGWEGVATVCDRETGKVLFYTNGDGIYNRDGVLMPGAEYITPVSQFFEPFNTVTQCLLIPRPGTSDQYYVLNTDAQGGKIQSADPNDRGVWAVLVDMSQNNGSGAGVDRFNVYSNPSFTTEKLMAVPREGSNEIFLIGHEFDNNRFFVIRVSDQGFGNPALTQDIGLTHAAVPGDFDNLNSLGELKASPDGTMIALAVAGSGFLEIFDFDNTNGVLSNDWNLLNNEEGAYGVSFSPDNSKLYLGTWAGKLYQFDLDAGSIADIINSKVLVYDYPGGCFGSLKIGPDEKIYVSRYTGGPFAQDGGDAYLGVIELPNAKGLDCQYVHDGIFLEGKKCNWGLNNVMEQQEFEQIELSLDLGPDIEIPDCVPAPVTLDISQDCVEDYLWQDGSTSPVYEINTPGQYWAELIYGNCSLRDSLLYSLTAEVDLIPLQGDTILCLGDSLLLHPLNNGIPASYSWQDGSLDSFFVVVEPGMYSVTLSDACGEFEGSIEVEAGAGLDLLSQLAIPDLFTPNNDGVNDRFFPVFPELQKGSIQNYSFHIYNRFGQEVFSSKDPFAGWDGRYQTKAVPADAYVWKLYIQALGCNGAVRDVNREGDLLLLR